MTSVSRPMMTERLEVGRTESVVFCIYECFSWCAVGVVEALLGIRDRLQPISQDSHVLQHPIQFVKEQVDSIKGVIRGGQDLAIQAERPVFMSAVFSRYFPATLFRAFGDHE